MLCCCRISRPPSLRSTTSTDAGPLHPPRSAPPLVAPSRPTQRHIRPRAPRRRPRAHALPLRRRPCALPAPVLVLRASPPGPRRHHPRLRRHRQGRRSVTLLFSFPLLVPHPEPSAWLVCLDGTPPAYHFLPGFGDGSHNWLLHLEGGSWCRNFESCARRKKTNLGSSAHMDTRAEFVGILSDDQSQNPGTDASPMLSSPLSSTNYQCLTIPVTSLQLHSIARTSSEQKYMAKFAFYK